MSRARPEPFTPLARRRPRNRVSQLLVLLAMVVTVFGGVAATDGQWFGLVLLPGGFVALAALLVWGVRHWEW